MRRRRPSDEFPVLKTETEGTEPAESREATEGLPGIEYATPDERLKPLYLLADSQLLFSKDDDGEQAQSRTRRGRAHSDPNWIPIGFQIDRFGM